MVAVTEAQRAARRANVAVANAARIDQARAEAERRRAEGKACSCCHMVLPLEMFTPAPRCADGREGTCKTCRADARRLAELRRARAAALQDAREGMVSFAVPWCCASCEAPLFWSAVRDWWEVRHLDSCARPWPLLAPGEAAAGWSGLRECDHCGEEYLAKNGSQLYCGTACRTAASCARHRARTAAGALAAAR